MSYIYKEFYEYVDRPSGEPLGDTNRKIFNSFVWDNLIQPLLIPSNQILLTKQELKRLEDFAIRKVKAKDTEWNGVDDGFRMKREMTGAIVEYALLKKYGKKEHFDDSIVTKSSLKNHPDLLPLGIFCDVKGSSMNNVPLIFKESRSYTCSFGPYKCPNVIGVTDHTNVWLLGIASPEVLQTYCDDNLIKNAENTTKTGFFGFKQLIQLPNDWETFNQLCLKITVKP